ncbi:MAG: hypothetical protein LUF33_01875 [Clostridiales bacterium]|nr:hypothetical protein [Clostridiales bacterium]
MKKILPLMLILVLFTASMCACTSDSSESSSSAEEEAISHREITDITELELDKIDRISSNISGEEIFTNDENTVTDFCEIIKTLTPNNDAELPEKLKDISGGSYEITAYCGDDLLYGFLLSAGDMDEKEVRVYNDDEYFYCDADSYSASAFIDIYQIIYSLADSTGEEASAE